jgi:uncharacterized protein involved in exopolysaccharide biosynthesis/Mrp family chromosome partitioning ATPase
MDLPPAPVTTPTVTTDDVTYALFRHKGKLLGCIAAGLVAAGAFYWTHPAPFQSEAMLFIRYVMEGSAPETPGNDARSVSPDDRGANIMNTEVEILTSLDIAEQAADIVGPARILGTGKGPKDRYTAAATIETNLFVVPMPGSSVLRLTYRNPNPAVVQPVLGAVIDAYMKKQSEVRGIPAVGDLLSQETDQLRSSLTQTEDDLRRVKDQAGIVSLDDAKKSFGDQEARIQSDIFSAQVELAERTAVLAAMVKNSPGGPRVAGPAAAGPAVSSATWDAYRSVGLRLDVLRKSEADLLEQFTPQSRRVRDVQARIAEAEGERQKLTESFPALALAGLGQQSTDGEPQGIDVAAESARLDGVVSRIKVLTAELNQVRAAAANLDNSESRITELQRQKDLQDTDYRYYATHLEANRIDEALGSGRALNIAEIQAPSPPSPDSAKTLKAVAGIAVAGLAAGLGWALLLEFHFDRSVRRPVEVERTLGAPLLLSIPRFGEGGGDQPSLYAALRDRVIGYFESRNLTHKPKLLAVTGVGRRAGATTVASGLAQCMSETGDGNVLLVDMTVSQGSARQFYKGGDICGFAGLLSARSTAQIQDKLFVVGEGPSDDKLSRPLPARFNQLVPLLKAGDFDYIIFDMPPVTQISVTARLAGFMDMALVVVEAERTDREGARRVTDLLTKAGAQVGVILNKTREYLPSWVRRDSLGLS